MDKETRESFKKLNAEVVEIKRMLEAKMDKNESDAEKAEEIEEEPKDVYGTGEVELGEVPDEELNDFIRTKVPKEKR